jgi:hypothetical protein
MKKFFILLALVVGGSSLATHSMAVPLRITMSVPSVSGLLDGVVFTDLPIAFTIQVDSDDIVLSGAPPGIIQYEVQWSSTSILLGDTQLEATEPVGAGRHLVTVNPTYGNYAVTGGFQTGNMPGLANWDLSSPVGPLYNDEFSTGSSGFDTDGGVLDFDNQNSIAGGIFEIARAEDSSSGESSSVAVPALPTFMLFVLGGLLALFGFSRIRASKESLVSGSGTSRE